MSKEQSPIEKAKLLKEQMEQEALQKQEDEKKNKRSELKTFLDTQTQAHQDAIETITVLKQKIATKDAVLGEGEKNRTSQKKEAKDTANILRNEEGKLDIRDNESIKEIFTPILNRLKEINEQVKIEKELKKEISKELEKKRTDEYSRAFVALKTFKEEHPELVSVEQKKESNEKAKEQALELLKKLETLKEKFVPYLNDIVEYEKTNRRNVIDTTALKRMKELDNIIEREGKSAEEKKKALDEEVRAYIRKGKGFFQSEKNFNEKCEQLRKNQKEQEELFWKEYRNAWDEKNPLQAYLYELERTYLFKNAFGGSFSDDLETYLNQKSEITLNQLFDESQKRIQKQINELVLDEDEMLLKEIADVLEKNREEARRSI